MLCQRPVPSSQELPSLYFLQADVALLCMHKQQPGLPSIPFQSWIHSCIISQKASAKLHQCRSAPQCFRSIFWVISINQITIKHLTFKPGLLKHIKRLMTWTSDASSLTVRVISTSWIITLSIQRSGRDGSIDQNKQSFSIPALWNVAWNFFF